MDHEIPFLTMSRGILNELSPIRKCYFSLYLRQSEILLCEGVDYWIYFDDGDVNSGVVEGFCCCAYAEAADINIPPDIQEYGVGGRGSERGRKGRESIRKVHYQSFLIPQFNIRPLNQPHGLLNQESRIHTLRLL